MTYGHSRNKRNGGSLSFNDNRSSTTQLQKLQETVGNNQAPIQFEKPKPLSEMVVDRITGNTDHKKESRTEVYSKIQDRDPLYLEAYRAARDHNFGLDNPPTTWSQQFRDAAPATLNLIRPILQEALHGSDVEAEQSAIFRNRFFKTFTRNDNEDKVARYVYNQIVDTVAAEKYLNELQHDDQNFDFKLMEDKEDGVQYQTPKAGLFGPSQSSLNTGTEIANRVLREAFESNSEQEIFFKIATAIGSTIDHSNDSLRTASKILEDYLRPKLMDFIYRLPLVEQEDDGNVWGGRTLNSNVQDSDGNQVADDSIVRPKVQDAWTQIRDIVSPAVLNDSGEVGVKIDGAFTRAYYSESERMIHMAKLTSSKATVMHEFGHHLEDTSKVSHWVKLQQLMRDRSQGGELKRIFPFTIPYVISRDEMRYDTDLPSSGEMGGCFGYNVKYYPHGSTEVVSTAFEVFHNRDKAFRIAVKDPGLFLAVMGVLRGR